MASDRNGKRIDDEDAAGWWDGLLGWLKRDLPPNFWVPNPKVQPTL